MTQSDLFPPASSVSTEEASDRSYGYALPGRRAAQVTATSMVLAFLGAVAVVLPQAQGYVVPLCASQVPLCVVALAAAVPLAAAGKSDVPGAALLAGWAAIVGGAACDIYATVRHSPDLTHEGNPVIRGLLDNGVSLPLVYLFGGVVQALFVGLAMVLWFGFLRHRHTLVATMPPHGSLPAYFKAGTGGRELSYRQWLCPLSYAELPWAYHLVWWAAALYVAASVYRFYLALEWYEVVPLDPLWVRLVVPSVVLLALCWLYPVWLRDARSRLATDGPPSWPG